MANQAGTIDQLPTPKGLPVLGNLHQMVDPTQIHATLEAWARELGPIFRARIGPSRSMVCVSDADAINEVLKARPETFRRWTRQQRIFNELLPASNGVFLAEADDWKRQRRLVMAALNMNNLQRYFESIRTSGLRLHGRLTEATERRETVDIARALNSFTVDVTASLVFGQDLNTLERGKNEFEQHFEMLMTTAVKRMLAPAPYWRWGLPLPGDRALTASMDYIDRALLGFLAEGRQRFKARPELLTEPENLLDAMLAAQELEGTFTDAQIVGNILILLVAGEDTTAQTLAWTTWLVATHPGVQKRLADEALAALGDESFPLDHQTVDQLTYAEAIVKESIRLRSVAPILPIETLVDTTVCGFKLPAGTELQLLLRHAAQDPSGDSAEFRPERWLDDGPTPPKTLSFGSGPRFCPGRNLALIEIKSVLAMMARDFEISLDPAAPPVEEQFKFSMAPSGLPVVLTPRVAASAVLA